MRESNHRKQQRPEHVRRIATFSAPTLRSWAVGQNALCSFAPPSSHRHGCPKNQTTERQTAYWFTKNHLIDYATIHESNPYCPVCTTQLTVKFFTSNTTPQPPSPSFSNTRHWPPISSFVWIIELKPLISAPSYPLNTQNSVLVKLVCGKAITF